jgi:hypothetical protein
LLPDLTVELIQQRALRWRREIVNARLQLAEPDLAPQSRAELWQVIECCEWALKMLAAAGFPAELEQIDRDIEARLRQPLH